MICKYDFKISAMISSGKGESYANDEENICVLHIAEYENNFSSRSLWVSFPIGPWEKLVMGVMNAALEDM